MKIMIFCYDLPRNSAIVVFLDTVCFQEMRKERQNCVVSFFASLGLRFAVILQDTRPYLIRRDTVF